MDEHEQQKLLTRVENLEMDRKSLEQRIETLEMHVLNLLSNMIERKVGK
jgi:hypothetical protein